MNPFDLSGPQFLLFYVALGAFTLGGLKLLQRSLESGPAPNLSALDAYSVAYLRAGAAEALRVATLVLLDRGLLSREGPRAVAEPGASARVRRPLERFVLGHFEQEQLAASVLGSDAAHQVVQRLDQGLRVLGLLPSDRHRRQRAVLVASGLFLLAGIPIAKVFVALARGRTNVLFLVGLSALLCYCCVQQVISQPRTALGGRVLEDLESLCAGLRKRASQIVLGRDSYEFAMLIGVFGTDALIGDSAVVARQLFPLPPPKSADTVSNDSGFDTSCSSSSGGGCGSSCGGGCGGCGS